MLYWLLHNLETQFNRPIIGVYGGVASVQLPKKKLGDFAENSGNFPEKSGIFCMARNWGINLHEKLQIIWTPTFGPKV